MSYPRPGDYITAKCTRCNDVTGHVIMLVLEGAIAKVECKACGSVHKYRDVKATPAKKKDLAQVRHVRAGQDREKATDLGIVKTTSPRPPAHEKTVSRPALSKIESAWQEAMVRHVADIPVPYSMSSSFEVNALVEHPKFGRGEVLEVIRPDKVEILFQDGIKSLRCKAD